MAQITGLARYLVRPWARHYVSMIIAAVAVVVLAPATAVAQAAITGVVCDGSGLVMSGVTVAATSPALIERIRIVTADDEGVHKIVDLRPGTYDVTFMLTGFSTARHAGSLGDIPVDSTGAATAMGASEHQRSRVRRTREEDGRDK